MNHIPRVAWVAALCQLVVNLALHGVATLLGLFHHGRNGLLHGACRDRLAVWRLNWGVGRQLLGQLHGFLQIWDGCRLDDVVALVTRKQHVKQPRLDQSTQSAGQRDKDAAAILAFITERARVVLAVELAHILVPAFLDLLALLHLLVRQAKQAVPQRCHTAFSRLCLLSLLLRVNFGPKHLGHLINAHGAAGHHLGNARGQVVVGSLIHARSVPGGVLSGYSRHICGSVPCSAL